MLLDKEEAKQICDKILSFSKADSATVSLTGSNSNNIRFALNTVSTCGAIDTINADITSNFGKKSGTVRITSIIDKDVERVVRMSEEIAKLSPDNEEYMPPLEKQKSYLDVKEFFEDTNALTPSDISEKVSYTLNKSIDEDLSASGYFEEHSDFMTVRNTSDLYAYHKNTYAGFSSTVRTKEGTGSSKIDRSYADINLLDTKRFTDGVIERTKLSRDPQKYEPGKYVTILDHSAAADMVGWIIGSMSRRSADEGRSFFSDKEKGSKLGAEIVSPKVNIYSDPQHIEAPAPPFSSDGYPQIKRDWIKDGVLVNLFSSRYWAKKTNSEHVSFPTNVIMKGSGNSVEDLIASTEKGIFVTRFWYIRAVDPKQILLTGLTRDGVFLIENGKIKHPVNNYRFNESPVNVLNNVIDMSSSEKAVGSERGDSRIVVPALKLSEFNFSTISDAI